METNVIVVGGGPPGITTALTAKSFYIEKTVCLINEIVNSVIPSAMPYMMHTMSDSRQNSMGNQPLERTGIEVVVGKVRPLR